MIRNQKYFIIILLLLVFFRLPAQQKSSFSQEFSAGAELYSAGKYQEAYDKWISLYNSGQRSAALSYNIGNACFKMNNISGSILFYERALLLKPADEDINYNLQIARTLVIDKFAEIPELFFITWFNFLSLSLSSDSWAIISLACFILSLILISIYFYSARYRLKVISFWLAVALVLISGFSLAFSFRNTSLVHNSNKAIITIPAVNGKSSPGESGNDLFVLHEGTKVTVSDEVGGWFEIRLSDGNKGWVPSNSLTKL